MTDVRLLLREGVVPLEQDLVAEIHRLRRVCERKQTRIRHVELARRKWAERARKAEREAELLRAGIELLTR